MTDTFKLKAGGLIDSIVADKVMGWKTYNLFADEPELNLVSLHYKDTPYSATDWNPSVSMDHAWQVVEAMRGLNYQLVMNHGVVRCRVGFVSMDMDWTDCLKDPGLHWCFPYAIPLAICHASLLVVDP